MLAGADRDRHFVLPHEIVGEADVIEVIYFDHDVIDSARLRANSEGNRMIAIIAMHEYRCDDALAHADFVFDSAAHAERRKKLACRGNVAFANDAMAEPAGPGLEPSMHPPPRVERLAELHLGSMKNLDGITVRIIQLH